MCFAMGVRWWGAEMVVLRLVFAHDGYIAIAQLAN